MRADRKKAEVKMLGRSFRRAAGRYYFLVGCLGLTTACGDGTLTTRESFTPGEVLMTSADVRLVHRAVPQCSGDGRVRPAYITCAEPSPDIAKAVSSSFDFGSSFVAGGLLSGISPEAAAAVSIARAESMAQLTQRLATIQLLRDGLYRACEMYANGALSETTYAMMLGRYDDTMVTMLLGELAAGNFGGQLAALGMAASGTAASTLAASSRRIADIAEGTPATADAGEPASGGQATGPSSNINESVTTNLSAAAKSLAEAANVIAARSEGFKQSPEISRTIALMQRKFIENINSDSLVVACVNTLDRESAERPERTKLSSLCNDIILPGVITYNQDLLWHKLEKDSMEENAHQAIAAYIDHAERIYGAMSFSKAQELAIENLADIRTARVTLLQGLDGRITGALGNLETAKAEELRRMDAVAAADGEVRQKEAALASAQLTLQSAQMRLPGLETRLGDLQVDLAAAKNDPARANEIPGLEQQEQTLNAEVAAVRDQVTAGPGAVSAAEQALTEAKERLKTAQNQLALQTANVMRLSSILDDLRRQKRELEAQLGPVSVSE
jgi:hypothetical protein